MSTKTSYKVQVVIPKPPKAKLVSQLADLKGNPCLEILYEAANKVIRDKGGSVGQTYSDKAGNERSCLISIRPPEFPLGIGIDVTDDGKVKFQYDALGDGETARRLCNEITQNYVAIAVMRAQRELGFTVRVEERVTSGHKVLLITGVK